MSEHKVRITWKRETKDFAYDTYDRTHSITFEGGTTINGSAAKEFMGKPAHVNPEEALAAALSACHMLTFLAIAAKSRLIVDSYEDDAVAILDKNSAGKLAVTKTILRPKVVFAASTPVTREKLNELHEKSHRNCFIASSVNFDVVIEAAGQAPSSSKACAGF